MAIPPNYCLFQGVCDMKTEDKTREQLLDELSALRQRVAELETSEAEWKRLEHALGKRVKELKCLYSISHIAEKPGITLDQLYQEMVKILPASWQYPEITCAQITINGKKFEVGNCRNTEWKQSSDIKVHGDKVGVVEVCYLEEKPELDEGPFLREERLLIDAVAEWLGRITERKQGDETIKQLAYYDTVTGLPNRTLLNDRIRMALAHARRDKQKLAIMMLDLDRFKDINDTLGHSVGDQLLRSVGNRLRNLLRANDTASRIGGDEFIVLLPNIARDEDTLVVAEKIIKAFHKPFMLDKGKYYHITTSIGIVAYPEYGENAETLLKNADAAMYRAKEQGRDQWQWPTTD